MFNAGDKVRLRDDPQNTAYRKGETYTVVHGNVYSQNLDLDRGLVVKETGRRTSPNGWFFSRFERAPSEKDNREAEIQKAKDEILAKADDLLDLGKKKVLDFLAGQLDKANASSFRRF